MLSPFFSLCLFAADSQELRIQTVERNKEKTEYIGEVDRATVVLSNGQRLKIPLFRAKPIAILTSTDGSYTLLAEGADCTMCDESTTIRFFPLGSNELKGSGKRYSYPGTLNDFTSQKPVEKTRVFFGRCMSKRSDVVIWFKEYIGDDGKWRKGKSIVRPSRNGEIFTEMKDSEASLESVLRIVSRGLCNELPGVDGEMEP
ncbi:MAG: hypothetical protein HOP32_17665 [Nitrospira sp.]|nr:hypothetical protein [Nitrospira sp.]